MTEEPYETEEYQTKVRAMRDRLVEKFGGSIPIVYEAFRRDDQGMPVDNLDEIAVEGKVRVEDDIHEMYVGANLKNPTWTDLVEEGLKMIEANGDTHHVFLIGYYDLPDQDGDLRRIALDFES